MGIKCETFNPGCNTLKDKFYRNCDYKHDQIIQHNIIGDPVCRLPTKGTRK